MDIGLVRGISVYLSAAQIKDRLLERYPDLDVEKVRFDFMYEFDHKFKKQYKMFTDTFEIYKLSIIGLAIILFIYLLMSRTLLKFLERVFNSSEIFLPL